MQLQSAKAKDLMEDIKAKSGTGNLAAHGHAKAQNTLQISSN